MHMLLKFGDYEKICQHSQYRMLQHTNGNQLSILITYSGKVTPWNVTVDTKRAI